MQPFHFLRTGDILGRAVVKIRRADGACGTGFLVAPDVLLTNHHVLPDRRVASAALILANYEAEPPDGTPGVALIEATPDPSRLFVTQDELDFTFCGVSGLEALGSIPLRPATAALRPPDVVNIIQHPRGRPKEVAIRDNQLVRGDLVVLHYACDTEPGSSGSPVFDHAWRLVAIHHASSEADSRSGGRRQASIVDPGIRFLNEGIRLSAIALWLETSEASGDGNSSDVSRLRSLFRGVDPRAGFFGALGRSPRGRSASEVVSEGPGASRGDVLDVAYWDLRSTSRTFLDRLDDLGLAIASMGMDLWLLSSVSPIHARAHPSTHRHPFPPRLPPPPRPGAPAMSLSSAAAPDPIPPNGPRRTARIPSSSASTPPPAPPRSSMSSPSPAASPPLRPPRSPASPPAIGFSSAAPVPASMTPIATLCVPRAPTSPPPPPVPTVHGS